MSLRNEKLEHREGDVLFEAHASWDDAAEGTRPAVLVCHAFAGQTDLERRWADDLAQLGYVGIALDVYGKGVVGETFPECEALMAPLIADRALLARRLAAAVARARAHHLVDGSRVAAIGFCFGGLCVLDLARRGADLRGVVSFHGMLDPPPEPNDPIRASVLVLHGHDDPLVPPESVLAFEREMSEARADWQVHAFGGVVHAFTNPRFKTPDRVAAYDERADRRSRRIMELFLAEKLA